MADRKPVPKNLAASTIMGSAEPLTKHAQTDPLWQKIWLLRMMYQYDCGLNSLAKLFEGASISAAVPIQRPAT